MGRFERRDRWDATCTSSSATPRRVTDEEFDHWYEAHLDEILSMPGFHSAQRYRLQPAVVDPDARFDFRNIVVYESTTTRRR